MFNYIKVTRCSSIANENIDKVWGTMESFWNIMRDTKSLQSKRARQRKAWMWKLVQEALYQELRAHPKIKELLPSLEEEVLQGILSPTLAAEQIADTFRESFRATR